MRPETQKRIAEIIESNLFAGFMRGQDLFAESFEQDLQKTEILEQISVDGVMDYLLTDYYQNRG